jgi:hypothetical protein
MVTCGYCEAVTRIGSTREHRRPEVPPRSAAPQSRLVGVMVAGGVLSTAMIAGVLVMSRSRAVTPASDRGPAIVQPAPTPPVAAQPPAEAPQPDGTKPDPKQGSGVTATGSSAAPARTPRKPAAPAAPTGPILTKKDAEEILRPEILKCMKEHGVHYLITRLGNERRGANVPALSLTETSIVEYKPTPGFAATPLGRCVARAGAAVRAPAYGGNYIYFGLRNESIPDPLADAPARLDTTAAEQALAALDDEARDCAARNPAGSRPGESVSVMVYFEGATGKVSRVEPYYIDSRSGYGRCLSSVYRKATVGKFRQIEHHWRHVLPP